MPVSVDRDGRRVYSLNMRITVNTDAETRAELNRLANETGLSRAAFLRLLVVRYGRQAATDLTRPAGRMIDSTEGVA